MISSDTSLSDFATAFIRRFRPLASVDDEICLAAFSVIALAFDIALRASTTTDVFACCTGYSRGTMLIAPEGQLSAQTPHPMHFSVSMMLFSVSVAPTGQTYRHRQSFVQRRKFLTATFFFIT